MYEVEQPFGLGDGGDEPEGLPSGAWDPSLPALGHQAHDSAGPMSSLAMLPSRRLKR